MEWSEVMAHAGHPHSRLYGGELWEHMRQAMPQYIWMDKLEDAKAGWCTNCEKWIPIEEIAQNAGAAWSDIYDDEEECWVPYSQWNASEFHTGYEPHSTRHLVMSICPECGARVQLRDLWRGRKSMAADRRFMLTWHKSRIAENGIVLLGYECYADWSKMDNCQPFQQMEASLAEVCVFQYGMPGERWKLGHYGRGWKRTRKCESGWAPGQWGRNGGIRTLASNWGYSLRNAAEGTIYEGILEDIDCCGAQADAELWWDKITLMDSISRYGCVEYLLRMGMGEIAMKVIDRDTNGLVNARGKNGQQVLKLTEGEWGEVKGKKLRLTWKALETRKIARENNLRMSMEKALEISRRHDWYVFKHIVNNGHPDVMRALKYCERNKVRLNDYRDMMLQMDELGMDKNDKQLMYPRNFEEMHRRYSERIALLKAEEDGKKKAKKNEAICARVESGELDRFFFSAMGLVMRPMMSASEIIREGTMQHNCVATYIDAYAEGRTNLCVIREEGRLEIPLYTVEFNRDGMLLQCRADHNKSPKDKGRMEIFWRVYKNFAEKMREIEKARATA